MLLLAIILIPIVAIAGSILGWRLVRGRKLYKFVGMVVGLIVLPALCVVILGKAFPNKAEAKSNKFIKGISSLHPHLICDDGDPGYGPDNTTPWYTGYYFVDASDSAENIIKQSASHNGIQLATDTSYIQQLKGQSSEAPFGDETFNLNSIYLSGGGLQVTIARDSSVPTWCQSRWDQQESVKPGKYILYSRLSE